MDVSVKENKPCRYSSADGAARSKQAANMTSEELDIDLDKLIPERLTGVVTNEVANCWTIPRILSIIEMVTAFEYRQRFIKRDGLWEVAFYKWYGQNNRFVPILIGKSKSSDIRLAWRRLLWTFVNCSNDVELSRMKDRIYQEFEQNSG